ncbi:MAG: YqzL family protein [Clostridia bacterium]|nr:YqzL family protein [Clostridia bacterium]
MINKLAWDVFKNTGSIDAFLELKNIEEIQKNMKVDENENNQSKWNSNFGK